jgi:hypothetical protein
VCVVRGVLVNQEVTRRALRVYTEEHTVFIHHSLVHTVERVSHMPASVIVDKGCRCSGDRHYLLHRTAQYSPTGTWHRKTHVAVLLRGCAFG